VLVGTGVYEVVVVVTVDVAVDSVVTTNAVEVVTRVMTLLMGLECDTPLKCWGYTNVVVTGTVVTSRVAVTVPDATQSVEV
jgi:hypothetical protein